MRILATLALAGAALFAAAAAPRDWSAVASLGAGGAVVTGNPQARVKLVEYASFTCSHCAHFSAASAPVLKNRMIRSGSTSLEVRHLVRDRLDLAATIAARCGGPRNFSAASQAIFAAQESWLPRGAAYDQANAARLQPQPIGAQLHALADGAGLIAIVKAQGLREPAIAACFADAAELDRLVAMTRATPPEVAGTPTFFINGKPVGVADWPRLEPQLRAAGAT